VAAWERATIPSREGASGEATSEHVETVSTSLRENHLPSLDRLGLVAYDSRDGRVAERVKHSTVELYVRNDPRTAVAWTRCSSY
jgi:hypothetical protein